MDFEFDKEIDFLLRQTAQGETALAAANPKFEIRNPKSKHLDADELSALAENALPEKAKQKYLVHLADCDECRKNLSGLIVLSAEASEETARVEERQFVPTPIPWYRKFFAVPNLIYTMGALVLLFSGIAVWTVLQSVNDSQSPTVSQTYEKQTGGGKGMSSDGDASVSESYSSNSAATSNLMSSNTAAMNSSVATSASSPANTATMPVAPYSTANSNAAIERAERDKDSKSETKSLAPAKEPMDLAKADSSGVPAAAPPPPPAQMSVNSREYKPSEEEILRQEQQASIAQNQADVMPDSRSVRRAPAPSAQMQGGNKKMAEPKVGAADKSKNATTTSGGKTFRREENVWYDTAYRSQPTINVTRGTQEYKKLDSGLRGIAENLGGTVVIVWKQKAYRIQ